MKFYDYIKVARFLHVRVSDLYRVPVRYIEEALIIIKAIEDLGA